jgi:DNA-binding MarR family transcriptional regulator
MSAPEDEKLDLRQCLRISRSCLGLNLRRADRAVTHLYDEAFRALGLRGTQFGLLVATRAMEPAPMSRVAAALALDRTTLTRNLKPLEKKGWLVVHAGRDRRERLVSLTPQGHRMTVRAYAAWRAAQARMRQIVGSRPMRVAVARLSGITDALRGA